MMNHYRRNFEVGLKKKRIHEQLIFSDEKIRTIFKIIEEIPKTYPVIKYHENKILYL